MKEYLDNMNFIGRRKIMGSMFQNLIYTEHLMGRGQMNSKYRIALSTLGLKSSHTLEQTSSIVDL